MEGFCFDGLLEPLLALTTDSVERPFLVVSGDVSGVSRVSDGKEVSDLSSVVAEGVLKAVECLRDLTRTVPDLSLAVEAVDEDALEGVRRKVSFSSMMPGYYRFTAPIVVEGREW